MILNFEFNFFSTRKAVTDIGNEKKTKYSTMNGQIMHLKWKAVRLNGGNNSSHNFAMPRIKSRIRIHTNCSLLFAESSINRHADFGFSSSGSRHSTQT